MANPIADFFGALFRRFSKQPPPPPAPGAASPPQTDSAVDEAAFQAFLARLQAKVRRYLQDRPDSQEQHDHLNHLTARTRWLYMREMQRQTPGAEAALSAHDSELIDASVFSHDMGKWIPREELRGLFSDKHEALEPIFQELRFSPNQTELFLLGIRRRFNLPQDGYTPEYDAAHHLVSAYMLVTDPALGFHLLPPADQLQLVNMVVGHQFGSYFKGSLLNLSLHDREVTTGMLVDSARSDWLSGDSLSSVFHDADISDLLFVGSLEKLAENGDKFHSGGLVKILMINLTNLVYRPPHAPSDLEACLASCQTTVNNACKEFLTSTAIEYGHVWREQARSFLEFLSADSAKDGINAVLAQEGKPAPERLAAARALIYGYGESFLKKTDGGNKL